MTNKNEMSNVENKRILVVDDNLSIHKDFTRILIPESENKNISKKISEVSNLFDSFMDTEPEPDFLSLDYEVDFAIQGEESLKMIEEAIEKNEPYSLVFMDIRMPPGWDGIKTLIEIFKIDDNIQAVISSAYSDYSFFDLKEKFGPTDRILFLKKPFDSHEVLQLAASLTNKWNLARENKINLLRLENELSYRNKIESQLVQAQKMESIGQIAGGLAHDFNNILSGIVGAASMNAQSLRAKDIDLEKLKRFNSMIIKTTERAKNLTNQLFVLSRKNDFLLSPIDLNTAIKNTIEICKNTFDKKIVIEFNFREDEKCIIDGDQNQLEQVILNMSINASHAMTIMREYSEYQGGILAYSLEKIEADEYFIKSHHKAKVGQYWKLSISDTGTGINSKNIDKIFDPFFTTKESGSGTGLGLSMVYTIIKRHNGFIDVYSEEKVGTNFNLYFPVIEKKIKLETKSESIDEISYSGSGTILIVDDDDTILKISKSILEGYGFTVLTAINGKEAVEIFSKKSSEIRLVILDLIMPELSGEETYLVMKEIDPRVKVLLISGFKKNDRIDRVMDLGIDFFIQKPFTLNDLIKTVKQLLENEKEV